MSKPQQPELARSGRGATDPASIKTELTAPDTGAERGLATPVPEGNLPGHRPEHDQDKPSGDAFVAKVQQLAHQAEQQVDEEAEVVDLRAEDHESETAERLAKLAGTPFRVAGDALQKVRDRL